MGKIKITICAIALLSSMGRLMAQVLTNGSIKGILVDQQQMSLPGATIVLKNSRDSSIVSITFSNENGAFSIDAIKEGNYFIDITMVGFEKMIMGNLQVNKNHPLTNMGVIALKYTDSLLAGVTVKAEAPLIERRIDKTVINVAKSITSDGATVLEVVRKLPGVQVSAEGQISMYGKSGVTVYIDGKPTYLSAGDLASLLNGMSASAVQRIEIMTNPSAKYDAAGTAGVINIVKNKNHKAGFNGTVSTSLGESHYGKYNGGLTLNYKNDHYNLFFNNTYSYNKTLFNRSMTSDILNTNQSLLIEQVSDNNEINTSRTYRPTLGIDLYLSKKTTFSLSGTSGTGHANYQTFSAMDILDSNRSKTYHRDFTSTITDNPFNYSATMQLAHQFDTAGKEFTINLDYSNYQNKPTQNNLTRLLDAHNNFISETGVLLVQQRQLNIYAAKADYVHPLKNNGRLEAGLKSSYVNAVNDNNYYQQEAGGNVMDSTQSDYSVNSENINAAYVNFNRAYKKITVEAGLRAEQTITQGKQLLTGEFVHQSYLQLFPALFLNYKLNDRHAFNIQLGRRTERAAYAEMVPFRRPLTATLFFQGNPNLKPHLSYHGEMTWTFQSTFFITIAYDIDQDYVQTMPYLDSNKTTITRRPTNVQQAHSWDLNLAYSKKLTSWWSTDNTLLFYQNGFNGEVKDFKLVNPGMLTVYLSLNNSFRINDKLSAEADFEYNSKRQLITSTFGAYSILSFGAKLQVFDNKGSISINTHNVLQSEGHNAIDHYNNLNQYAYVNFYTRSVSINFSYRFGYGKAAKTRIHSGATEEQKRAGS